MKILLNKKTQEIIILVLCFLIFSLLLFKDIFSTRTLVPNLEPYPDSIHYINPAFSLINGYGLFIEREGRLIQTSVPPLYTLVLTPVFLINQDARLFYFTNIFLAFLSLFLLYKILKKAVENIYIIGLVLFLYITNYFVYWYPTIPMAENLLLTLFLGVLFLILCKVNYKNLFISAFLVIGIYFTKFASIPLLLTFIVIFTIKIFTETKGKKIWIKNIAFFYFSLILITSPFYFYDLFFRDRNNFAPILNNLNRILFPQPGAVVTNESRTSYFSASYFIDNFRQYLSSILGKPLRFLWDNTPLVPSWVGILGIFGLVAGLSQKKLRLLNIAIIFSVLNSILFLSFFYTVDARYIYFAIPSLLIGLGILLSLIYEKYEKLETQRKMIFYVVLVLIFILYSLTNFGRLKYQISLNLRHGETPWYYVSVTVLNNYFQNREFDKRPIVISALPPFYVDFFSNKKYDLLPLSKNQEFRNFMQEGWGITDASDLHKIYTYYLENDYPLFVSTYGLGNEQYLHNDYDAIEKDFTLTKVKTGCDEACNIYKVTLKNENNN